MQEVKILKVRFNKVTLKEATDFAIKYAKSNKQHYFTTPNPEILLEAQKNHKFHKVLNNSSLNIADGVGILWASKYLALTKQNKSKIVKTIRWFLSLLTVLIYPPSVRTELPERVTGVDLMKKICGRAPKEKLKIFLLGAKPGTAEKVKEIEEKKHKGIKIVGTYSGTPLPKDEHKIITTINKATPDILFVAYGAPAQELWIARNLKRLHTVKLAIGVGGAFNFIAKIRKRAPKWLGKLGLEWTYRLAQEPSRIKRIYNATLKFATTVLKESFKS